MNSPEYEYIQFCRQYQRQMNFMLRTQDEMHVNLLRLLNNNRTNQNINQRVNQNVNENPSATTTNQTRQPLNTRYPVYTSVFAFPLSQNNRDNFNTSFNNLFSTLMNPNNESFLNPVPIVASREQQQLAIEQVRFSETNGHITQCPISLIPFNQDEEVSRIIHCGHIFNTDNLRRWFTQSSRCPVCRYDIREYTNNLSNNDLSNNDLSNNDLSNNNISNNNVINNNVINSEYTNNDVSMNDVSMNDGFNENPVQLLTDNVVQGFTELLRTATTNDSSFNETLLNLDFTFFNPNNL
jgi:hypothetical protein